MILNDKEDELNAILEDCQKHFAKNESERTLMQKYDVIAIEALGEIFNPNFHEAISIVSDPALDDNTIIKEIRK